MYKLIATDCDRTLIDSKGYMPKENLEILRKLHNMGIYIIIATGRNDILAKDYLDELDIGCPIIGCNGATMCNFYTGENYFIKSISEESLNAIFDIFDYYKIGSKIFTTDTCYTDDKKLFTGGMQLITTAYTKKMNYHVNYELVEDMHSVAGLKNVLKAVIINNDIDFVLKIRDEINANVKGVRAVQSNWNCIDINVSGISKGNAVIEYANIKGISPEEIIAFGDSENDISMIKYAGLGIAVDNADENVKQAADQITDTNDNAGVAKALRKIFNI